MSFSTDRIQLFDRNMNPLRELAPNETDSRVRREELNGEHELTVTTSRRLEEGWRALTVDGTGKWREWVVVETPEEHSDGGSAVGTYRLVWSLQYDLTHSYSHTESEVGYGSMPKTAQEAAEVVLDGVARWEAGTCDGAPIESGKGCVFVYESAWSKLSKVVELTGWEVDAVIEVSNLFEVTARKLCLRAHVGTESTDDVYFGRNLLRNTEAPSSSNIAMVGGTLYTGGVIRLTPTTSDSTLKWRVNYLDYEKFSGDFVISYDARIADVTSTYSGAAVSSAAVVYPSTRVSQAFDQTYDRRTGHVRETQLTSEWKRFTNRVRIPDDLTVGASSALVDGSQLTVLIVAPAQRKPIDIRRVKLERGTYATPWSEGGALPMSSVRRFDWGEDVTSIKRTPDPGPYYCRVVPLGRGTTEYADDDETTFEWPLDITEEEPDGNYYIEDKEAAAVFRIDDGDGGWIYPTKAVSYSEDDPELLYNAALEDLHNHTRPGVTYEANVLQFARAGMAVDGVALGDDVQIVDRGFSPEGGLQLQGRVTSMQVDELSPETGTELTIGNLRDNMSNALSFMGKNLDNLVAQNSRITDKLRGMSTSQYIDELLDRINTEINATGGYGYFVPGEGIITYDIAVDDPLVGYNSTLQEYATQVTQVKGGNIRIANSKEAAFAGIDDWDWRTVFTSGHILSDLVTTAKLTAGYIGNATSGNYWNLDTGELRMQASKSYIGDTTITNYVANAVTTLDNALDQTGVLSRLTGGFANQGLYISNGRLYINASFIATGELSGFKIISDAIYTGTSVSSTIDGAVALTSSDFTRTINGTSRSTLRLAIGGNFGVTKDGKLYASNADISGKITATSGTIGGFTISSSSIYNSMMTLDSSGLALKRDSTMVGNIGTNNIQGYSSQRGLVFDLEYSGNYMTWAVKESSSASAYTMKLTYAARSTNGFTTGRLSVSCNLDLQGNLAYNFWIDPNTGGANGGVTGTMYFVKINSMSSDGTAASWNNGCRMQFENGILTSATF